MTEFDSQISDQKESRPKMTSDEYEQELKLLTLEFREGCLFGIEATVDQANMIWGWNYLNFLIYPTIVSAYYGSWVCLLRAYRKGQI